MGQRSQLFKGYSLDVLAKNRCGQKSKIFKGYSLDVFAKNRWVKRSTFQIAHVFTKNRSVFSKGIALMFLPKIDGSKDQKGIALIPIFSKGIALMFLPKIDGFKNPNFSKGIALIFCQKSMGQKSQKIFKGYSLDVFAKNRWVQKIPTFQRV